MTPACFDIICPPLYRRAGGFCLAKGDLRYVSPRLAVVGRHLVPERGLLSSARMDRLPQ